MVRYAVTGCDPQRYANGLFLLTHATVRVQRTLGCFSWDLLNRYDTSAAPSKAASHTLDRPVRGHGLSLRADLA